ncbi:MAG: YwaF family protein [Mogibacterium sp.]|nr:YwaF family protein [Mogibacterium sp.]
MSSDFWIMRPFNTLFILVFAAFLLLLILASLILRNKSERTREAVLVGACLVTFVGFFIYKYYLSIDEEFNVLTAAMGGFNWWGELPLQLCNINMILIPIGVLRKSRPLMNFGFFLGPLGALMALVMPTTGFNGYSLLLPRMLGFYGTHFMIVIEGLALVTFGLFRPVLRDLPKTILTALAIAFIMFLFNMFLRWTGLHPKANYFFAVETEGNPILELFHSWLPYPFLYLLPCVGILAIYMGLVMLVFTITDRRKR